MAGTLVDPQDRFPRRPDGEAEDLAGVRVEPGALEMHAFVGFDREVGLVGIPQLDRGDPEEPRVHVHECRHRSSWSSAGTDTSWPVSDVHCSDRTAAGHRSNDR